MRAKQIKTNLTESIDRLRVYVSNSNIRVDNIEIRTADPTDDLWEIRSDLRDAMRKAGSVYAEELDNIDFQYKRDEVKLLANHEQEIKNLAVAFYNIIQAKAILFHAEHVQLIKEAYKK